MHDRFNVTAMIRYCALVSLIAYVPIAAAIPKIKTEFAKSLKGYIRMKVINETNRELACYVAIDGRKIKFRLPPRVHSRWYKATDTRFTAESFSTWCDYIELYPEYRRYVIR